MNTTANPFTPYRGLTLNGLTGVLPAVLLLNNRMLLFAVFDRHTFDPHCVSGKPPRYAGGRSLALRARGRLEQLLPSPPVSVTKTSFADFGAAPVRGVFFRSKLNGSCPPSTAALTISSMNSQVGARRCCWRAYPLYPRVLRFRVYGSAPVGATRCPSFVSSLLWSAINSNCFRPKVRSKPGADQTVAQSQGDERSPTWPRYSL